MRAGSILVVGWALFMLCAYPGVLDEVALAQLREGRAWELTDRGAPAMAALWGLAEHIISGPFVLLVLQSTLLLAGAYGMLRRALQPRPAALAASAILLAPPVLAATMVIGADRVMAGLLLVAAVALLHDHLRARTLGLVACALAIAFRLEAIAATLPLVVLLFDANRRGLARYGVAVGAWLAVCVAGLALDAGLTHDAVATYAFVPGDADVRAELPVLAHDVEQFPDLKEVGLAGGSSRLQDHVRDGLRFLARRTPVFRPFFYLVLAVILLPFCRRQRDVAAVLASGIALGVVLLPAIPSVWTVLCACLAVPMLVARRRST